VRLRFALRPLAATASAFLIFLLGVLPAAAAEGEGGDVASSPLGWTFRWLNFAIVAGVVGWLLVKKAPPVFRARAEAIRAAIEESERTKAAADRQQSEAAGKLARLDQEIAGMREASSREAAAETERIGNATRDEIAKVGRAAQAEIAAAARAARQELKIVAARLAVTRAQDLIPAQMSAGVEAERFRTFVRDLGRGSQLGSRN
jgi:F-type H+-transporting ATPase subunit b